jgi:Domain of unknown function (DUF4351)
MLAPAAAKLQTDPPPARGPVARMQEYDVALKLLLQRSARLTMRALTGQVVTNWLDVELPKIQNLRLDLLGETAGGLVHLELQSSNDAAMSLRMAEYSLGIYRLFGQFAQQVLLYVGEPPLRMSDELRGPDVLFRYRVIDIRTLDGDCLIESDEVGDNVIAILARLRDHREAVRRIVARIARLPVTERDTAMGQLLVLAGLRRLARTVEQEARQLPIRIDILENEVLGPIFLRGCQKGELTILRGQIQKRFGPLPAWADEKLAGLSTDGLEELSMRVLDAHSIDELLK